MKNILTCLLLCICCNAFAGIHAAGAAEDKSLMQLFDIMKNEDNYGYDIKIISRLEGNTDVPADTVHMSSYQSRKTYMFYTRSADALFFVSRYGQFRINNGDKTVYYRQYSNDSMAAAVMETFRNAQVLGAMDSLFLSGASVSSKKQDKDVLTYVLKYQKESAVKSMKMVYDRKDTLFKSISYTFQRTAPDRKSVIEQQVSMDHYTRKAPAEIQHLEEKSRDLKTYLYTTYKGYTIKAI